MRDRIPADPVALNPERDAIVGQPGIKGHKQTHVA